MAATTVLEALNKLDGRTVAIRQDGLEDLRRIFGTRRNGRKAEDLRDDVYHRVFESLYQTIRTERSAYVKALRSTKSATSTARIETCSAALRVVVEAGYARIKYKTAISVLDHIVETLPISDQELCEPLRADYIKCFRTILDHAPLVEHLKPKQWQGYLDFALAILSVSFGDDLPTTSFASSKDASAQNIGTNLSLRASQGSRKSQSQHTGSLDDVLGSLRSLTGASNAPILSRAAEIFDGVVDCLVSSTRSQEIALEVFNSVALTSLGDDIRLLHQKFVALLSCMRRLWFSKSPGVRTQLLATFSICQAIIQAHPSSPVALDQQAKLQLLEMLQTEYQGRSQRDLLQLDDIELRVDCSTPSRSSHNIGPALSTARSATHYLTLNTISRLHHGVQLAKLSLSDYEPELDQPRKRRKALKQLEELLEQAVRASGPLQVAALQTLVFLCVPSLIDEVKSTLSTYADDIVKTLLGDDAAATWSYLLLSQIASIAEIAETDAWMQHWGRVWEITCRATLTASLARPACYLLSSIVEHRLLRESLTASSIQMSLFAGGKNGPAALSDAALWLFTLILQSAVMDRDVAFENFSMKVVQWLGVQWTLPVSTDRAQNASIAFNARPELLCALIAAMQGIELRLKCVPISFDLSSIIQLDERASSVQDLSYLLSGVSKASDPGKEQFISVSSARIGTRTRSRLQYSVTELLQGRLRHFREVWDGLATTGRSAGISNDVLAVMTTLCIVSRVVVSSSSRDDMSSSAMMDSSKQLWRSIIELSQEKSLETEQRLMLITAYVLRLQDTDDADDYLLARLLVPYTQDLLPVVKSFITSDTDDEDDNSDMLDSLDTRTSQGAQAGTRLSSRPLVRFDTSNAATQILTLPSTVLYLAVQIEMGVSKGHLTSKSTATFIDELSALESATVLDSQQAILQFLRLQSTCTREQVLKLLQIMGTVCLGNSSFDRCEAALCLCTRVMTYLVTYWTPETGDDLDDRAYEIYEWLISNALGKRLASTKVMQCLAELLDAIACSSLSYGESDLPSTRTSLLKILKDASCLTKLHITPTLNKLFGRYVLSEHGAVFNDVVDSLPSDPDNINGIGVRFRILADIGSQWHTVLRQATYSMFETAVNATALIELQRLCTSQMSSKLGLSSRKLFSLFAPQILFTWLGVGMLKQMPFRVFAYESLQALAGDNEAELVAHVALRSSKEHAAELSSVLSTPWKTLLQRHFATAEAYCLSSQMTLPQHEQLSANAEANIRKEIGAAVYGEMLQSDFASIIAVLFRTLQDDNSIQRAFQKAELQKASDAFMAMSTSKSTPFAISSVQQPFFRSRFLIDEIRWMCSTAGYSFEEMWSPAVLVYLYRRLLSGVYPALGPLHASMTLRRIRIVIALGGVNAVQGYPLEMLLHNLRPYLTTFHCSEDAIGVYKYLLEQGADHLRQELSFLAGTTISIFASLTTFVASSQDSTTQESQFVATMSKAQTFRRWLGSYLNQLTPRPEDSVRFNAFKALVQHAQDMDGPGNSSQNTHQGAVLLALLEDQNSSEPLLRSSDFELCIAILCEHFVPADLTSEDILTSAVDAANLIASLQKAACVKGTSDAFRVWAGHMIGRGVSQSGPFEPTSPLPPDTRHRTLLGNDLTQSYSYSNIVKLLASYIWSQNGTTAASAERCLQTLASDIDPLQTAALFATEPSLRLLDELRFDRVRCPTAQDFPSESDSGAMSLENWKVDQVRQNWTRDLLVALCSYMSQDPVLHALLWFVQQEPDASRPLLHYVVHLILAAELDGAQAARPIISKIMSQLLASATKKQIDDVHLVLDTIVYLRRCKMPKELSSQQRVTWLEIDFSIASQAATTCELWNTALLMIELQQAVQHLQASRTSRRSTQSIENNASDALATVYRNVDDPDFFYAGHEDNNINSIVQRLNHEAAGYKMLSFQSAIFDSLGQAQSQSESLTQAALATARALSAANLKGISHAVRECYNDGVDHSRISQNRDSSFSLFDWDVVSEHQHNEGAVLALHRLHALAGGVDKYTIVKNLNEGLLHLASDITNATKQHSARATGLISLGILAEAKDALDCSSETDFRLLFERLSNIDDWGARQDFGAISQFLTAREYIFGSISQNTQLRAAVKLTAPQAILFEALAVRQSLRLAQENESSQFGLARATYLSSLSHSAAELNVKIETAAKYDMAKILWTLDEGSASVTILQALRKNSKSTGQDIPVSMSEILAELGQKVTEARLEPANEVIDNYLVPAYKELGTDVETVKAGRIYHVFASFCDSQLQDPDNLEEYARLCQIKQSKEVELAELQDLYENRTAKNHEQVRSARDKARIWFKLDNQEWERVRQNRESLVLRCLEHYLLSLKTCDDFPNDTLRVISIWLDETDNIKATNTVHTHLQHVPSWKFAALVNQLSSRLMDTSDAFQQCLMDLMFRICSDHPFHSLYQLFALSKTRNNKSDEVATSRHAAANKLADHVLKKSRAGSVWPAIHNLNIAFVRVAQAKLPDGIKQGGKLPLKSISSGSDLIRDAENGTKKIPPPTLKIAIRPDRQYSSVPTMLRFDKDVSVAGGLSAPKIATVIASDGSRHKMLLKGGNDDLRQDAIMEQVFEQVSNLLRDQRATRERKLGIRTYKVVPLLNNAGIIEFVQNTLPLHEWMLPAHARYFPKDFSNSRCRREIDAVKTSPAQQRIRAFRTVTQNFRPVMRFFFMEKFLDPDEWFYKRLNYSRSTAAISILGHVLGLGDRHGHNILLDAQTGEVVHIDLGVAFEAGRILPIPEVVPFRLTRDLVDGMGISGVEGVFRRCCNFTLEALRKEQESIMTILDVLRYDPLYSWSVSPLRQARMQENANRAAAEQQQQQQQQQETNATGVTDGAAAAVVRRREGDESAEASRALAVVAKKLGKGLSVEATVNELIRQATDERNLAVLFSGWAAYA